MESGFDKFSKTCLLVVIYGGMAILGALVIYSVVASLLG